MDHLILPLSIVLAVLSFSLIAKWYVIPALAPLPHKEALTPFLLLHSFRYVGMAFLIPGVTSAPLDPRFANPAAWGTQLAAVLALIALLALRLEWRLATAAVWVFNIEGTLDLMNALFQVTHHFILLFLIIIVKIRDHDLGTQPRNLFFKYMAGTA